MVSGHVHHKHTLGEKKLMARDAATTQASTAVDKRGTADIISEQ